MSKLRNLAAVLVCCLLLVPAATRATQPLHTARTSPVPSFSKSVDVPPDPIIVIPDLTPEPIDTDALAQPVGRIAPAVDEILPPLPGIADGESLRAPPVRLAA